MGGGAEEERDDGRDDGCGCERRDDGPGFEKEREDVADKVVEPVAAGLVGEDKAEERLGPCAGVRLEHGRAVEQDLDEEDADVGVR